MPRERRFLGNDEELGKKNDDFRPRKDAKAGNNITWSWKGPRRRRLVLGLMASLCLYFFFKNMPSNVPNMAARGDPRFRTMYPQSTQSQARESAPQGPPPAEGRIPGDKPLAQNYEGPIHFFELAESLSNGAGYHGISPVVFVAANLKSLSGLAPLACSMAVQKINNVHFLLISREDIPIKTLKEINGINDNDCPVLWHDGRPDYAALSTDLRMEVTTKAALHHFNMFLHPKTALIDSSSTEEAWLGRAVAAKAAELGLGFVRLPQGAVTDIHWITRLDATSLRDWNNVDIELLIHAPHGSSGGLIRLLQSIGAADYSGGPLPKLTVELPSVVDGPTARFLDGFRWPPGRPRNAAESKLTLRHHLSVKGLDSSEASIKTIESFYPSQPFNSHVLVLSPQAELAPSYFQYLKFLALKYKHSSTNYRKVDHMLGISLDMPTQLLDAQTSLTLPRTFMDIPAEKATAAETLVSSPLFLWQAPNSNAALYFGDKWAEMHSYISNRLKVVTSTPSSPKLVSELYPSWMEYFLELSRARGYFMLYPSFSATNKDSSLVTIHQELYQPPEEFTYEKSPDSALADEPDSSSKPPEIGSSSDLTVPFDRTPSPESTERVFSKGTSVSSLLQLDVDLIDVPSPEALPLVSCDGKQIDDPESAQKLAKSFADAFAVEIGGCKSPEEREETMLKNGVGSTGNGRADDLFCL